jgi:hypothetical protein
LRIFGEVFLIFNCSWLEFNLVGHTVLALCYGVNGMVNTP